MLTPTKPENLFAPTKVTPTINARLFTIDPTHQYSAGIYDETIQIRRISDSSDTVIDSIDARTQFQERVDGDGNQMRRVMDLVWIPKDPKQLMIVSSRATGEQVIENGTSHKAWCVSLANWPFRTTGNDCKKSVVFFLRPFGNPTGAKSPFPDESSTLLNDANDNCGEILWETRNVSRATHAVCFSPNGQYLLRVGNDCKVIVKDATNGKILREFVGHRLRIRDAEWSADGNRIATASEDGSVRVWDFETGETTCIFQYEVPAHAVTWHPDGKRLAAAFYGGKVRVWDARAGYD